MARIHSRKHGRSGSTKPPMQRQQWLLYDKAEVEKIIEKLAKSDKSSAEIGAILRDSYGIPQARALGIRINKAKEKTAPSKVPEDLFNIIKQAVDLHRHLQDHRGDAKAIHGLQLVESKVRRLGKYYTKKGKLPQGWKYNIEEAKLLVR